MTDDHDIDLSAALSRLRTDVRRTVAPPAGEHLRRRAEHRVRTRRAATALVAAAVVGVVLVGGGLIWRGAAPETPPVPGGSPTPTGAPSAQPLPSRLVPSRPAPQIPAAWAGLNWATATITLPTHEGCPSGPVTFREQEFKGSPEAVIGPTSWPKVSLQPLPVVYGDVTGDGQAEAVVHATCWQTAEDSGDGQGQLLVIRRDGTTLRGIGWAGPRGGLYSDRWIDGGRLVMDVAPWHVDWGYRLGAARAYRWTGQAFTEVDSGLPGLVPGGGAAAPLIDLGPAQTGCPRAALRFGEDRRATAADTTWDLFQPGAPDSSEHLVDLDGDGRRWTLVTITCGREGTNPGNGFLAVLDRQADGSFLLLDAIRPPAGTSISEWTHRDGTLILRVGRPSEASQELRYTWNGDYFQR